MRVVCTPRPEGKIYRVYRTTDDFTASMRKLLPFLNECAAEIVIGGSPDAPGVALTIGPFDAATEEAFRKRVKNMLEG